jgi:AefR-like transcriptional repressor, C-terminal domain
MLIAPVRFALGSRASHGVIAESEQDEIRLLRSAPPLPAMMRIAIAQALKFPELRRVMASIMTSPGLLTTFLIDRRARGLMEFDDAYEMARLFNALVDGD